MNRRLGLIMLPVLAVLLVAAVVGLELGHGGGQYSPLKTADPCVSRPVDSVSSGIEGLTEKLVLIGLDNAACRLGVSREELTLRLAQSSKPSDVQVNAVRAGLLAAVDRLNAQGQLPRPSQLTDEALAQSNLNSFVKTLIQAIPDAVIDKAFSTDDVLKRTVNNLDLRQLLSNLSNGDQLDAQVQSAVKQAVQDALVAKLRSLP